MFGDQVIEDRQGKHTRDGANTKRTEGPSPAAISCAALLPVEFLVEGPGYTVYAATKHAVRALSEGLRQEVKPYNICTTVISPGAVATELPDSSSDAEAAERIRKSYADMAIPADSFARTVAFAISQPDEVDINEILFRPTRQPL